MHKETLYHFRKWSILGKLLSAQIYSEAQMSPPFVQLDLSLS